MKHNDFLKVFNEFVADKNIQSDEEFDKVFEEFIRQQNFLDDDAISEEDASDAYDFLELAETALSKKEALKYAKKALEIEPDNVDAEAMVAELTANSAESLLDKFKKLIDKTEVSLKSQGYFDDENIGEFWLIPETRPYMRLRAKYVDLLLDCMMFRAAAKECENMLRLCENDNLGIRYRLMHIYAYLEDEGAAIKLFKQYEEEQSAMFLLPLSMLFYKLGDFKKSAKYLKELNSVNKDTLKFFRIYVSGDKDEFIDSLKPFGYRPFSIEEFVAELSENNFMFVLMDSYFKWGLKKLRNMKK
ncbi:MAG: tetratricopeptide repeat protein [Ruminococcus sp.]